MAPASTTALCIVRVEHQPHISLITVTATDDINAPETTQRIERFTEPTAALASVAEFLKVTRKEEC